MGNGQRDWDGGKVVNQEIEVIHLGSDGDSIYGGSNRDGQRGSRDDLEEEWTKLGDWFVNACAFSVGKSVGNGLERHETQRRTQDNFRISRLDNGVEGDAI